MTHEEIQRRLLTDLEFFSQHQLKIVPKEGGRPKPFVLNRAQRHIHQCLEDQRKRTGKVRAYILKGRQQGVSTYVGARYYFRTVSRSGVLTFIFAHDSSASDSLYNMVQTYYDLSDPSFRPLLGARNHKELFFPKLRSGYKVGTAGTTGLGRSKTFQQVHWSEVAYSPNANDHAAGILQTVSDMPDTEIILESTANGEGDFFHTGCMQALSGQGEFQLIFVPWYWQDEYKKPIDDVWLPSEEEQQYLDLFSKDGLTKEHLQWRRSKVSEFIGDVNRFKHEYPFTPEEAFEASDEDSFIKAMMVRAARNTPSVHTTAPLVFGVDPAALGGDKFRVVHRKGRNITKIDTYPEMLPTESARRLAHDIKKYNPARVCIDAGGLGLGVYSALLDMGYKNRLVKIDFGGKALDPENNYNRTAEMYRKAREWLEDKPVSIHCDDKLASALQAELSARKHTWHNNSQLRMEPKAEVKKRLGYSPDTADAFILTFAEPIPETAQFGSHMQRPIQVKIDGWNPF
jgi:hypothetical protein